MSLPLSTATRATLALARKSALLAHVSSTAATAANTSSTLPITDSGSGPSVSSVSTSTFLLASLAAKKSAQAAASKKHSLPDDQAAEAHDYVKAVIQSTKQPRAADKILANMYQQLRPKRPKCCILMGQQELLRWPK
ncbi:hypothetical protein BDZ91DRAFT_760614 [Kalaharituber pfeilii]|nr:hypothetical protein BDZ91DRAFT_760614 [Kalaharituber pfeilii]